ncbi:hypothetical protein TMES_05060 [Thalassospira mesophila]|uniref:Uncharacterized protein n=1 Tax=Thalassospira mesophila TaxID=1293891 RepID=A0A1Y2L1R7_9PROT|nr:hypothetical protein TMES_05060 [Thalassospira mesophila]
MPACLQGSDACLLNFLILFQHLSRGVCRKAAQPHLGPGSTLIANKKDRGGKTPVFLFVRITGRF